LVTSSLPPLVDQADPANIDRLLTDRDLAAADIDVGVAERVSSCGIVML
jgi:hypothetical protein